MCRDSHDCFRDFVTELPLSDCFLFDSTMAEILRRGIVFFPLSRQLQSADNPNRLEES
jgi:hypothetical protein